MKLLKMSKSLMLNDPGYNKYKQFCLNYYKNIYYFFIENGLETTWFNLCQIIYLAPNLVKYVDKYRHSNLQLVPMVYNPVKYKIHSTIGDVVGFFDRLFNNFEAGTVTVDTRYNMLRGLVSNVIFKSDDSCFLEVRCQIPNAVPITIGNIKFLMKTMSIETVNGMLELFRKEFNMTSYCLTESTDELEKGSGFIFMCRCLDLNPMIFKNKGYNLIRTMVFDFLHITQYVYKEQVPALRQFRKRLFGENYFRFINWKELRSYKHYVHKVINTIEEDVRQRFKAYDGYKLEDIPNNECNKYKIEIKLDEQQHPDYQMFKYLVYMYLKIRNLDLKKDMDVLFKVIERERLDHKLIYLRTVIKEVASQYDMMWKTKGYILLYNLENLFGYRYDAIKLAELESQVANNFGKDNEKNGDKQKSFFVKYFDRAISWVQSSVGYSIIDKVQYNLGQMAGNPIYYNKHLFFDADGATHERLIDRRGKKQVMSKTQFFSRCNSVDMFFENISPRFNDYNSIVVKRETVKDRIVVNTSLDTYIPLCKIEYILHKFLRGIGGCYSLLDDKQKTTVYGRFLKYCMYNKYKKRKYVLLPLDYSSYDTTITFDLIKTTIRKFGYLSQYGADIAIMCDYFEKILRSEEIRFNELGTVYQYKYGILSGWKITNLVESLLNFVISYGVLVELGYNVVDLITMGDDIVMVIDYENLNEQQLLEILSRISDKYKELGFNVHPIKNMVGYESIEFLRNYYNGLTVVTYPIRSVTSVAYCKPTSHLEFNNYSNYKSILDEFIYKNGAYMFRNYIYGLMKQSTNKNVKMYGLLYIKDPDYYNLEHKMKYEYKFNNEKEIRNSQIYNYYLKIFGQKHEKEVFSYVKNNIFSKKQMFETIVPRKVRRNSFNHSTNSLMRKIIGYFKNIFGNQMYPDLTFNVGDYYINDIARMIYEKDKSVITTLRSLINNSYCTLDRKLNMLTGLSKITNSNIKLILSGYKLRIYTTYYNSAIVKSIKKQLFNYLIYNRLFRKMSADNILSVFMNNVLSNIYKELSTLYITKINGDNVPVYLNVA